MTSPATPAHPPSVDALARSIAASGLPQPICVDIAREAIAANDPGSASARARAFERALLTPVVNATGVLLHTNLGRAPLAVHHAQRATNIEFDLESGERSNRQRAVGALLARLCGAEAAMVVNNNAAAVMLVLAALAYDCGVVVSRGESVEIGGAFHVPEVMEQSGATLIDVGTTNRTRLDDYSKAIARPANNVALALKVHPSNFRIEGFVEDTSIAELATLSVPVVADIGSGLIDTNCPWLGGAPPSWLATEPGAKQSLEQGAALVTFSGDKLFGGPQAGVIVGRREFVERCMRHPLARALRPGALILSALQDVALAYLDRRVTTHVPFWRMAALSTSELEARALEITSVAHRGTVEPMDSLPGAGSAPGAVIPSCGIVVDGDHAIALRAHDPPVIGRVRDERTYLDLRSVDPADDPVIAGAISLLG